MFYAYKCESETCENIFEIELPLADEKPTIVECPLCKGEAHRYWKGNGVVLPENFRAANGDPGWTSRYGKFPPGIKGKYF